MSYNQSKWYKEIKASQPNCIYCDEQLTEDTFTVDHIELASLNGANSPDNCKPCCKFCNNLRDNMDYNEFVTLYPKDKLIKLKEYTLNNQDINGVLIMKESIDTINNIQLNINQLIERKKEIDRLTLAYKKLSEKIRNEIVYSKNLNASDGYKLYVKQREIDRQYLRYKNESKFLNKYTDNLSMLIDITNSMNKSMSQSMIDNSLSKPIPTLEDDLETIINSAVSTVVKTSNKKNSKTYSYNDDNKKQKLRDLKTLWNNIKDDTSNRKFVCSDKK